MQQTVTATAEIETERTYSIPGSFIRTTEPPPFWLCAAPEPPPPFTLADDLGDIDERVAALDPLLSGDVTHLWNAPADGLYTASVCFREGDAFDCRDEAGDPSGAVPAVIIECRDEYGTVVDLAAWRPGAGKLALWRGRVFALGQDQLLSPRGDEPLRVFPTVMAWLRGGRDGIVIVDFRRAALALSGVKISAGRDIAFAQKLRAKLTIAPQIFVGDDE